MGLVAERDRLAGLIFARTKIKGRAVATVPGSEAPVQAPLTVSSTGSIPVPVAELPMSGELYRLKDLRSGEVEGLPCVFALGNAVTGKANILNSPKHGKLVAQHIVENFLTGAASGYKEILEDAAAEAREKAAVGYPGDSRAHIATVRPTC